MVKPWVVHASVWVYKVGLVGMLVTVTLLAGSDWVRRYQAYRRALMMVLVLTAFITALAGWFNDAAMLTMGALIFSAVSWALIRVWRIFLALVIALVWWIGAPTVEFSLQDRLNVRLPAREIPLAPGHVCRSYPKYFDSSIGTRLVSARTDRSWFWDDVTEGVVLTPAIRDYGCTLDPGYEVVFWYRDGQGYREVRRKVE